MKNLLSLFVAFALTFGGALVTDAAEYDFVPASMTLRQQFEAERLPPTMEYQELLHRLEAAESRIEDLEMEEQSEPMMPDDARGPPLGALDHAAVDCPPVAPPTPPAWPSVKLSGFFHLDAGHFDQDAANRALLGDIQDGVSFRRTRLQAVGSVAEFTNFSVEMDFAQAGRPSFQDVWGEQTHVPFFGNVRIGQYRLPLTMDSWTSIRQLWFLERSLPFQAFDPFRRVGIMAYDKTCDENWAWAYSVYRTGGFRNQPLGDGRFGTDIGDNNGISGCGRLTHLLWYDEPAEGRYLLHVGGSCNYSLITGGTPTGDSYESRPIPEFFVGNPEDFPATLTGTPPFVDTGRLAADAYQLYNAQVAWQYGPAHFQGEYMFTNVNQIGNPDVQYDGAYAQFGYFLTGENYTYNRLYGVFDKVVPHTEFFGLGRKACFCGWGAWEVCAPLELCRFERPERRAHGGCRRSAANA